MAKGDLIMLCDADLVGFREKNIELLVNPVLRKECDLTISNRAGDMASPTGYINASRFFCGERVFWKKDFEKIKFPKYGGYLLEVIMDLHYIKNNKKVMTVYFDNLHVVFQFQKISFWKGILNYVKMYKDILLAAKPTGLLKFFLLIKNDRFGELYEFYYKAKILKPLIGILILLTNFIDGFYLFFKLNLRKTFNKIF